MTGRLTLCAITFAMLTLGAEAPAPLRGPILDAHNCYVENGKWADRLARALGTNRRPIGIEQDLVWKPDGQGGGTSYVAHSSTLVGGEPTLDDHFFKVVAPTLDAALKAGATNTWPLIILHFDFKTNEPEHHRYVLSLLQKYGRWLTTTTRGADDRVQALKVGPLMVLTEAGENQQRDFYDTLPVGAPMVIFGTVPNVSLSTSRDRDVQADAAVSASPSALLPSGATNYRRWANFGWAVVERGGQTKAGEWDAADAVRLRALVARAHDLGLWLRFYTLDGFTPADNQGWGSGYNFGSVSAARERWRAAISAGVDLIATDQYEALAGEMAAANTLLGIAAAGPTGRLVSERFQQLTRAATWRPVGSRVLEFNTHHPQGLVKIGEAFYLSSVEVTTPPRRFPASVDGFDRDTGAGRGHLFKFDGDGRMLADLTLGEGSIYHPGGIDYDGQFIWVPVAEYRPGSRSIVYRIDPALMTATEVFRYPDHIGGIVHDRDDRALHGVTWGARMFVRWPFDTRGRAMPATPSRRNTSFYIDYQDCKTLGQREMLCAGLSTYRTGASASSFALGGMELVDLATGRAIHQIPIELWTDSGLPMTQNPFWIEPIETADGGLRVYFLPEDRRSTLYVYEVSAGRVR